MTSSTTAEIWDSLGRHIQGALKHHVRRAEEDERYWAGGRWRTQEYGAEALELGLIEPGEHPKHFLTELGWELGRHGLKLEKEEDGKET